MKKTLIPIKGYFFTPILLWANLIHFLAMVYFGSSMKNPNYEVILNWGASFEPLTTNGEWWRLITSCFVHVSLTHLCMNAFILTYIGRSIEEKINKYVFLFVFLVSGVAGSYASLLFYDNGIAAGASGAIFGLFGYAAGLVSEKKFDKKTNWNLAINIIQLIAFSIVLDVFFHWNSASHAGGFITGVFTYYLFKILKND